MSKHLTRKPAGPFHWDGHDPVKEAWTEAMLQAAARGDAARAMLAALHKIVDSIQAAHNDTGNTIGHIVTGAEAMETGRAAITQAQLAGITPAIVATDPTPEGWDIDGLAK